MIQIAGAVGLEETPTSYGLLEDLLSRARGNGPIDLCRPAKGHFIRVWLARLLVTVLHQSNGVFCLLWLVWQLLLAARSMPILVKFMSLTQVFPHWLVSLKWLTLRTFHLLFWLSRSDWRRLKRRRKLLIRDDCLVREDRTRPLDVAMTRVEGFSMKKCCSEFLGQNSLQWGQKIHCKTNTIFSARTAGRMLQWDAWSSWIYILLPESQPFAPRSALPWERLPRCREKAGRQSFTWKLVMCGTWTVFLLWNPGNGPYAASF